jgi:hypothetical protein
MIKTADTRTEAEAFKEELMRKRSDLALPACSIGLG